MRKKEPTEWSVSNKESSIGMILFQPAVCFLRATVSLKLWWHEVNKFTIVCAQENSSVKCSETNAWMNGRVNEWNSTWYVNIFRYRFGMSSVCACVCGRVRIIFKCNRQNGSLHFDSSHSHTHKNARNKMHNKKNWNKRDNWANWCWTVALVPLVFFSVWNLFYSSYM